MIQWLNKFVNGNEKIVFDKIWVVASTEIPIPVESGQPLPSAIFVPASAGLLLASTCVDRLIEV